jgi:hypothetical protein
VSRLAPLEPQALAYDKRRCASLDGFTLHAATRAGALDPAGREAQLRYLLRPPVAQERMEQRPDGLVRITLKKAYTDGTIAVDVLAYPRCQGRMKLLHRQADEQA